jgi:hypothetical protein
MVKLLSGIAEEIFDCWRFAGGSVEVLRRASALLRMTTWFEGSGIGLRPEHAAANGLGDLRPGQICQCEQREDAQPPEERSFLLKSYSHVVFPRFFRRSGPDRMTAATKTWPI